jgi:hypothetical protein
MKELLTKELNDRKLMIDKIGDRTKNLDVDNINE